MQNFEDVWSDFGEFGDEPFHLSVDLDSTLCDTRHRKGVIEKYVNAGLPIDWDDYARHALKDRPTALVSVLQIVQGVIPWHVNSGRSAGALEVTHRWLERHKLKPLSVNLEDSRERHLELRHTEWKIQRILELGEVFPIRVHIDDYPGIEAAIEERSGGRIRGMTVTPPGHVSYPPESVQAISKVTLDNPQE